MEGLVIREPLEAELPRLHTFEKQLVAAEIPFDPTIDPTTESYYDLSFFLKDPDSLLLVAEWENDIVATGYVTKKKARTYLDHEYYAHFGFMYTQEQHRGKGINQRILEQLSIWAKQKGFTEARLTVYSGNTSAIKSYLKFGFQEHLMEMRMPL